MSGQEIESVRKWIDSEMRKYCMAKCTPKNEPGAPYTYPNCCYGCQNFFKERSVLCENFGTTDAVLYPEDIGKLKTMDEIEREKRDSSFSQLELHLLEAKKSAVELKLGEHFISDLDHLRVVVKANREDASGRR